MAAMEKGKSCGACHNGKKTFGVEACVTCHPVREITWQIKATGPTHFSHTTHLQAIKCGACHPKLYAANSKNRRTGMAAMEKGASCGACHNAKQAFSIKECSQCHPVRELMFEEKEAGNAVFSHKFHTGLYTCSDCHPSLYPTTRSTVKVSMQEMEKGKSCGSCHEGKTAFSVKEKCEACHKM
jgi:c(7)-type cytochrome triheme protein